VSFSLRFPIARRLAVVAAVGACLLGLASARAQPAAAGSQPLDLRVSVSLAPGSGAALRYRGTFTGAPLGSGKVSLVTRLGGGGDATVSYKGVASITKGTGSYKRVRSRALHISGRAGLTAENVTLSLVGPISS